MNITAHPVAPEEVMAFLDGELSAAEARTVSTHIEHCADCAKMFEQFQSVSQSLAEWKVDPVPVRLEKSVNDSIAKINSGLKIGKASLFVRSSFWTRKQWVVVSGGAVAALLLFVAISMPNMLRSRVPPMELYSDMRTDKESPNVGSAGKLQASPTSSRYSNPTTLAPATPGTASYSKGLVRGVRGHDEDSFEDRESASDDIKSYVTPMIARTVSLSIIVKDFASSRSLLDTVLARHRGYFGQLNVSTPENSARSLQASLRIPAPELAAALADLRNFGRVENESQSGEEVTQQHADLVARLKTSRETEQRFRAILQQRTGKLSDVLQVEEGIARVRGDIEGMEAEQKELEHRVNFATVELHLTEEYRAQLNPPAASVSTRIYNGLVDGYHNAQETVLGIVIFFAENGPTLLIWLMILVLPAIFIWRRYRKSLAMI
jgi:hypothetical protein